MIMKSQDKSYREWEVWAKTRVVGMFIVQEESRLIDVIEASTWTECQAIFANTFSHVAGAYLVPKIGR